MSSFSVPSGNKKFNLPQLTRGGIIIKAYGNAGTLNIIQTVDGAPMLISTHQITCDPGNIICEALGMNAQVIIEVLDADCVRFDLAEINASVICGAVAGGGGPGAAGNDTERSLVGCTEATLGVGDIDGKVYLTTIFDENGVPTADALVRVGFDGSITRPFAGAIVSCDAGQGATPGADTERSLVGCTEELPVGSGIVDGKVYLTTIYDENGVPTADTLVRVGLNGAITRPFVGTIIDCPPGSGGTIDLTQVEALLTLIDTSNTAILTSSAAIEGHVDDAAQLLTLIQVSADNTDTSTSASATSLVSIDTALALLENKFDAEYAHIGCSATAGVADGRVYLETIYNPDGTVASEQNVKVSDTGVVTRPFAGTIIDCEIFKHEYCYRALVDGTGYLRGEVIIHSYAHTDAAQNDTTQDYWLNQSTNLIIATPPIADLIPCDTHDHDCTYTGRVTEIGASTVENFTQPEAVPSYTISQRTGTSSITLPSGDTMSINAGETFSWGGEGGHGLTIMDGLTVTTAAASSAVVHWEQCEDTVP